MQYDHIRLAFSVVLLGMGLSLMIADFWARRAKTSPLPVQNVKFGPVEVSTTSLGLAIIALAIPILLLSRFSVNEAERRGREQLIAPLFKAYQSSINNYFDLKKMTVQDSIDNELSKKLDKELISSHENKDQNESIKILVHDVREKERELFSKLDDQREALIQSANKYITDALTGDAEASLATLDSQITAKQEEIVKQVSSLTHSMVKILTLIP